MVDVVEFVCMAILGVLSLIKGMLVSGKPQEPLFWIASAIFFVSAQIALKKIKM